MPVLQTGNGIIQTGNGIISPISRLPIKNLLFKFLSFNNDAKAGFENGKWNCPNRKWNYFSYLLTSDQKTSFTEYC